MSLSDFIYISLFLSLYFLVFLKISGSFSSKLFFHVAIWPSSIVLMLQSLGDLGSTIIYTSWIVFLLGMFLGVFGKSFRKSGRSYVSKKTKFFSISEQLKLVKLLFFCGLILFFIDTFVYQQDVEGLQGATFAAASKGNKLMYVFTGLQGLFYWLLAYRLAWDKNILTTRQRKTFLWFVLVFPTCLGVAKGFVYVGNSSMETYANKIFMPVLFALMLWYLKDLEIKYKSIGSIKIVVSSLVFSVALVAVVSIFGVDTIIHKISARADVYPLLTEYRLIQLVAEYQYNFLYFFQPFLKLFGMSAYEVPMGSYLNAIVNGFDLSSVVGGVNVHLPLVLYVIFGGGNFAIFYIFIFGIILGIISRYSLINGLYAAVLSYRSLTYLFLWYTTPLLITEASAWGHFVFFYVVGLFLLWFSLKVGVVKRSVNYIPAHKVK